jgi:hypothetical protein
MEAIKQYTTEEWLEEAERRFGEDFLAWKFKCPMCGHVASVADFQTAGAKNPNCAYTECIGRYTGQGSPSEAKGNGCDWAAYGLFGIPKGGVKVDGRHIFDFAD